jgi:hypothetical protein
MRIPLQKTSTTRVLPLSFGLNDDEVRPMLAREVPPPLLMYALLRMMVI